MRLGAFEQHVKLSFTSGALAEPHTANAWSNEENKTPQRLENHVRKLSNEQVARNLP